LTPHSANWEARPGKFAERGPAGAEGGPGEIFGRRGRGAAGHSGGEGGRGGRSKPAALAKAPKKLGCWWGGFFPPLLFRSSGVLGFHGFF